MRFGNNREINEWVTPAFFRRTRMIAVLIIVSILVSTLFLMHEGITQENIVMFIRKYHKIGILIILGLFALKSLSIFIPLAALYLIVGILYSSVKAVLISFSGLIIALTIPWLLGHWSGDEKIDYLKAKYPRIEKLVNYQKKNEVALCFITRLVGGIPCDVLSFYFGKCKLRYGWYLLASLSGCALSLITITLLGNVVFEPFSKKFNILLFIRILISVFTVILAYLINKRRKKDENTNPRNIR